MDIDIVKVKGFNVGVTLSIKEIESALDVLNAQEQEYGEEIEGRLEKEITSSNNNITNKVVVHDNKNGTNGSSTVDSVVDNDDSMDDTIHIYSYSGSNRKSSEKHQEEDRGLYKEKEEELKEAYKEKERQDSKGFEKPLDSSGEQDTQWVDKFNRELEEIIAPLEVQKEKSKNKESIEEELKEIKKAVQEIKVTISEKPVERPVEKKEPIDDDEHKKDEKEQRREHYSKLSEGELYETIREYMKKNDVSKTTISKKALEDEFGVEVIRRMILKSYLIMLGSRVTIGKS